MQESSVYTGQTAPPAFRKAEINFVYLPTSYLRLLFIIHWDVSVPDMSNWQLWVSRGMQGVATSLLW